MTQMTLEDLTQRVRIVLERSALEDRIKGVAIEPTGYENDDVLRITIRLSKPDTVDTDKALELVRQIHDELSELDERFPSVRFAEAA